jgi:hypothetical protein
LKKTSWRTGPFAVSKEIPVASSSFVVAGSIQAQYPSASHNLCIVEKFKSVVENPTGSLTYVDLILQTPCSKALHADLLRL